MDTTGANGIFNVGTGKARSCNGVINAIFNSVGKQPVIKYIPMPEKLQSKYQYYTCADNKKFISTGLKHNFYTLESAIDDYVVNYLVENKTLCL